MENYVYVILDITKPSKWFYKDKEFDYEPFYVGMGIGYRHKAHLTLKLYTKESNFTKHKLIKKLIEGGNPPLSLKIYENLDRETAKDIEIDMIKHFGKLIDKSGILTNITDGGDDNKYNKLGGENPHSKKVYQYSLDGKFIKEWDCLREVGRQLKLNFNTIGDCCRGKISTSYGFQWSYTYEVDGIPLVIKNDQSKHNKKVYKFDDNGKLIDTYDSLLMAAKYNDLYKTHLSKSIIDNRIYHNFFYTYDVNYIPDIKNTKCIHHHKIEYNGEMLEMTNKEIVEKFNVSKTYFNQVKLNKIKKPKFKVIY